jgi:hypothetical protein
MTSSTTYTCDAPECDEEVEVPFGKDPKDFGVVTVLIDTKSVAKEDSVKHIIGDCEEQLLDGTWSLNDLFMGD